MAGGLSMTIPFWIWTHLSFALVVMSLTLPLLKRTGSLPLYVAITFAAAAMTIIPVHETDLSGFAMAHMGTLSVPTVILMSFEILVCGSVASQIHVTMRRNHNIFWVAAGLFLYPSATGFLNFDVYSLGYAQPISWCVVALTVMGIILDYQLMAFCLTSAVLAHCCGLFESPNLWDYLIDPWLFLAAIGHLIWTLFGSGLFARKRLTQVRTSGGKDAAMCSRQPSSVAQSGFRLRTSIRNDKIWTSCESSLNPLDVKNDRLLFRQGKG